MAGDLVVWRQVCQGWGVTFAPRLGKRAAILKDAAAFRRRASLRRQGGGDARVRCAFAYFSDRERPYRQVQLVKDFLLQMFTIRQERAPGGCLLEPGRIRRYMGGHPEFHDRYAAFISNVIR